MRSGGIRKQTERVATVTPTVAGEARESATPPFLIYLVMYQLWRASGCHSEEMKVF